MQQQKPRTDLLPRAAVTFVGVGVAKIMIVMMFRSTFSEPIKVLRVKYTTSRTIMAHQLDLYALHLYGVKAAGELPEDILFLNDDAEGDPEFIRDLDWGDRQEGTTILKRIKLFNSSTTKIASNLSLSLIDTDLLFSVDEGAT